MVSKFFILLGKNTKDQYHLRSMKGNEKFSVSIGAPVKKEEISIKNSTNNMTGNIMTGKE